MNVTKIVTFKSTIIPLFSISKVTESNILVTTKKKPKKESKYLILK